MKNPFINIIILHYKNLSDTRECLESLKNQDYKNFSVIVVNNDAPEHKTALEAEYRDFVKIIQNSENLGFCEGNNIGIRSALTDKRTNAVLLLNNDAVADKSMLSEMAQIDADMVAPRMMQYHISEKIDNLGIVLMSSGLPFNRTNQNQKLFCPSAGCALYSRELLETVAIKNPRSKTGFGYEKTENKIYYFDPLYFAYAEDLDLGWRARNAGFSSNYAENAIVYHKGSAIHGKLSDFAVYHTYRNLFWTQFKNFSLALLLWQSPWLFSGWICLFFYYLFKGRAWIIIKAWLDALKNLHLEFWKRKLAQKQKTAKDKTILNLFQAGLFPKKFVK